MREPSLSECVRKPWKQLIDIHENSGFNREKKPFEGTTLVVTAVINEHVLNSEPVPLKIKTDLICMRKQQAEGFSCTQFQSNDIMCSSPIMDISDHKSYNLGENKIERKTPVHFEIKNEADQGPKCTFFFILNLGGVEG